VRDRPARIARPGAYALVSTLLLGVALMHASAAEAPAQAARSGALLHETDGRAYPVERIAKAGAKYEKIDAHTVRYYPFARYELAGEDADYLYVKQYVAVVRKAVEPEKPAATEIELEQTRRFELRDFGSGLPHSGQWRGDFALADIDGDGHPDIVSTPARKSLAKPLVLLGDGHGAWARWTEARFPELPYDYGAASVADFNGDGFADIAFGMHLRGLTVLAGDGKGGFSRHDMGLPLGVPGSKTPAVYSTHQVGSLDWSGDGKPTLLSVGDYLLGGNKRFGTVSIFSDKRGSWSPVALERGALPTGNVLLASRAGRDGKRALVVGDAPDGRPRAYEFASRKIVSRALDGLPAGAVVRAVAAADERGDGSHSIAVAYQRSTDKGWQSAIDVFRRDGRGYRRQPLLVEPILSFEALAFGHLRSAHAFDFAALRSDGALLLFAADAKGGYTRDHVEPAPDRRIGCGGRALQLRDLDGDGRDEIVAAFAGEPNPFMLRRDCVGGGSIEAWKVTDATTRQE
jgi:hypothetical protein